MEREAVAAAKELVTWTKWLTLTTLFAALVALFAPALYQWLSRPRLQIHFEPRLPFVRVVPETNAAGHGPDTLWLRVGIVNAGRSSPLHGVEVHATELRKRDPQHGRFQLVSDWVPNDLNWSSGVRGPATATLPAGLQKLCDVLSTAPPGTRRALPTQLKSQLLGSGQTLMLLAVATRSTAEEWLQEPGAYEIVLRAAAPNARPIERTLEVTLEPTWDPHTRQDPARTLKARLLRTGWLARLAERL